MSVSPRTSLVYFNAKNKPHKRLLSPIDAFFSCLYPSGALLFSGCVDVDRFVVAVEKTLSSFSFLFKKNLKDASVDEYSMSKILLEVGFNESTLSSGDFNKFLPQSVDKRMTQGVIEPKIAGELPLCAIRLSVYKDGFSIGYYMSHSLMDQGSTVYFFYYLSMMYTQGKDKSTLPEPVLCDIDFLEKRCLLKSTQDLKVLADSLMGFRYVNPNEPRLLPEKIVELSFDTDEMTKFIEISYGSITKNDIIHAIILKIYALNSRVEDHQIFCLSFPCNMRKRCGLGIETIGNVIGHSKISLTFGEIRCSSVFDLARKSRECVASISIDNFFDNLVWYREFSQLNEDPRNYLPVFNFLNCRVTNWSSFDYGSIQFDLSKIIELKSPCYAKFGVNVISFDNKNGKNSLKTTICVPSESIEPLMFFSKESKLFNIHWTDL